jgi:hypothetical protein
MNIIRASRWWASVALFSILFFTQNTFSSITPTCPTNPNTTIYNTNYLSNINVCGPLPGQTSPIRQYNLHDVTITMKSNGAIIATGKCPFGVDNIGTTGYNNSCGSNPTTPGLWACASGDNRACYKTDGTSSAACTQNQTRDSTLNCVTNTPTIIQDCPIGQYKNSSNTCVAQTKCHVTNPTGVNPYFDVNTGTCKEPDLPSLVCGSPNTVACEPLNDCIKTTEFCSNSTADKAAHDVLTPALTAQHKTAATNHANEATTAAGAAMVLKSAADNDIATKQSAYNSANSAYQANPTPSNLAAMATALNAFESSSSAANKTGTSATASGTAATNANNANNAINNNTQQGTAENKASEAEYWKREAQRAMQAAGRGTTYVINNYPSPGNSGDNNDPEDEDIGSFTGEPTGNGQVDGLAAMNSIIDVLCGGDCSADQTETITDTNSRLFSDYSIDMQTNGQCPPFEADLSAFHYGPASLGEIYEDSYCDLFEASRNVIETIMTITITLAAIFIILGA